MNAPQISYGIKSTAGAVPVRNDKGELSMQKVKVQRYISGKRPEYARADSTDDDSDFEDFLDHRKLKSQLIPETKIDVAPINELNDETVDDPRLRRLRAIASGSGENNEERLERRRHIQEPEEVSESDSEQSDDDFLKAQPIDSKTKKNNIGFRK